MSFFDDLEECFNTRCLYTVLQLTKEECSEQTLKKAYYKKSLLHHPDRCNDEKKKNEHTKKFQLISKIYSVLSNKESKAVYDETGELPDDNDDKTSNRDWVAYWRVLYQKITKEAILEFEKGYKGTEEEVKDLKEVYLKFEGDMKEIIDNILCATIEDEDRFREILEKHIKDGSLPPFDAFTKEDVVNKQKRKRKAAKEAKESEELAEELGLNTDTSLENMILARKVDREKQLDNFYDNLAAKYSKPKQKKAANNTKQNKGVSKEKKGVSNDTTVSSKGTKRKRR